MRFSMANNASLPLSNMNDNRAWFTLSGDLSQMGTMARVLTQAGFNIVWSNVYPGFTKDNEEEYVRALRFLYDYRIEGWWNQRGNFIRFGICTEEEYWEYKKR